MLMLNTQTTKKGEKMYSLTDNVFGTNLVSTHQYYWGSTQEDVIVNHYYAHIKITVNNRDDTIVTPVQLKTMCHVTMNECATMVNGILVCRNDEYQTCRLQRGTTTSCLYSKNRLTCPEIITSITSLSTATFCNLKLVFSDQGLIYTTDVPNQINSDITLTDTLALAIRSNAPLPRLRR